MNYTKLKVISKWLTRISMTGIAILTIILVLSLSDTAADLEGEKFAKDFCEDLLEEDYESIHAYVFRAEQYGITVEDVKAYITSQNDLRVILDNPETISYVQSGDAEYRSIVFLNTVGGKEYSFEFDIRRPLYEMQLYIPY